MKNRRVIALVAGELSGDILGSGLIRALKLHFPDAHFVGVGGPLMIQEGLVSFCPIEHLSVMGLVEILRHLPRLLRLRRNLAKWILRQHPSVMIGIDSPDFNLGLEKSIRAQGVKTVQYVCPSVWAWREGRIKDIKQSADLLLTLFPFESAFLQNKKVEAVHVGHPLADKLICSTETRAARKALKIDVDGEWVGLLPGSRYGEVSRLLPPFLESASRLLSSRKACRFIIPAASPSLEKFIRSESESVGLSHVVHVVAGRSQTCMEASDLLLMASGTATLEAVLIGRPMVVCYRLSALTYQILKRMIRVPFFSLPNLLSGRKVVPEMIQRQVTGERVAAVLERYLNDSALCREQLSCFESIRTELALGADQRAASAIASLLHEQAE